MKKYNRKYPSRGESHPVNLRVPAGLYEYYRKKYGWGKGNRGADMAIGAMFLPIVIGGRLWDTLPQIGNITSMIEEAIDVDGNISTESIEEIRKKIKEKINSKTENK